MAHFFLKGGGNIFFQNVTRLHDIIIQKVTKWLYDFHRMLLIFESYHWDVFTLFLWLCLLCKQHCWYGSYVDMQAVFYEDINVC